MTWRRAQSDSFSSSRLGFTVHNDGIWKRQSDPPRRGRDNSLVKETMSREQVERLTQDIADVRAMRDHKGGTAEIERQQIKMGNG